MRTTDFDRIATSTPLDATAATVRDGIGDLGASLALPAGYYRSDCPLPVKTVLNLVDEWTGRTVGFFRVLGVHDRPVSGPRRSWVVRCACGYYETRTAKALAMTATGLIPVGSYGVDRCIACGQTQKLRDLSSQKPSKKSLKKQRALMHRATGDGTALQHRQKVSAAQPPHHGKDALSVRPNPNPSSKPREES